MKTYLKIHFLQASIGIMLAGVIFFGPGMDVQAKTLKLSFSHHLPPISPVAISLERWAKRIETETGGQIAITIFPSGTLAKGSEAYSATSGGICDISFANNIYERQRWALNQIVTLDALPIPSDEKGIQLWDRLWEKFPVMLKEFEGVKVLAHSINPHASMHTQKAVRVPADTKGIKIAAFGTKIKILEGAGAAPVGIPANDWYLSLEKGVIEGTFCPIHLLVERGIESLTPYHLDLKMGQGANYILMNINKWNSLPQDIKEIFENLYSWTNEQIFTATNQLTEHAWSKCREEGQTVLKPTPEEMQLWLAAAQPTADYWIKQNIKKGPTKEMFEYAKRLLAEMEQ